MNHYDPINPNNMFFYAASHYRNLNLVTQEEFNSDLRKPQTISTYLYKYKTTKVIKEQRILNILITFFNVFENECALRLLFYIVKREHYSALKSFLIVLGKCPTIIRGVPNDVLVHEIEEDREVLEKLKIIKKR